MRFGRRRFVTGGGACWGDAALLPDIRAIRREHPDYGARQGRCGAGSSRHAGDPQARGAADGRLGNPRRRHRRPRSLTKRDEVAPPIPDLIGRLFGPGNTVDWVGDVTASPMDEGWLHFASALDSATVGCLGKSTCLTPSRKPKFCERGLAAGAQARYQPAGGALVPWWPCARGTAAPCLAVLPNGSSAR